LQLMNTQTPWVFSNLKALLAGSMALLSSACDIPQMLGLHQVSQSPIAPPEHYRYEIVNTFKHDPNASTQGLVFHDHVLYESTGRYGQSSLREVNLQTGEIIRQHRLDSHLYGEGLAIIGDRIIQLTWKSRTGFVYQRQNFRELNTFAYATEGWGLTYDGSHLIMSDGSAHLQFLDPITFTRLHRLTVKDSDGQVSGLNELEYIQGEIYANIARSDHIIRINPNTGHVTARIHLDGLNTVDPSKWLNGIAYDPSTNRLFVTGKRWPQLFEIKLLPTQP